MKESAGEPAGALREGYTEPVSHATHVRAEWLLAGEGHQGTPIQVE